MFHIFFTVSDINRFERPGCSSSTGKQHYIFGNCFSIQRCLPYNFNNKYNLINYTLYILLTILLDNTLSHNMK